MLKTISLLLLALLGCSTPQKEATSTKERPPSAPKGPAAPGIKGTLLQWNKLVDLGALQKDLLLTASRCSEADKKALTVKIARPEEHGYDDWLFKISLSPDIKLG